MNLADIARLWFPLVFFRTSMAYEAILMSTFLRIFPCTLVVSHDLEAISRFYLGVPGQGEGLQA